MYRTFLDKKSINYVEYRNVLDSFNIIGINNNNIATTISKIDAYSLKYPKTKYLYNLLKEFLLHLGVSIEEDTNLELSTCGETIMNYINKASHSVFFENDSWEEKQALAKSVKKIFTYYVDKYKNQVNNLSPSLDARTSIG